MIKTFQELKEVNKGYFSIANKRFFNAINPGMKGIKNA